MIKKVDQKSPNLEKPNNLSDSQVKQKSGLPPLLRSSSMVVAARVFGAVFGIGTQFFLARFLDAEQVGRFFYITGLASVLAVICTMGYPLLAPRIAAMAGAQKNPSLLSGFISRSRLDALMLCAGVISGLLLAAWLLPVTSSGIKSSLFFTALTLPAFAMLRLNGSSANAQRRFTLAFFPDLFFRPMLLFSLVVILWLYWQDWNLTAILIGHIVISAVLAFWQMYKVDRTGVLREVAAKALQKPQQKPDVELVNSWRRGAVPLVIVALFIGVFADLDIVIIRLFFDDAQTGIFGICLKVSLFVAFGIQAVHQLILRDIADALNSSDTSQVQHVIARANILALVGSIGATLVVVVYGREGLGLFGPEFKAGYESLLLLMMAQVLRAAAGPAVHVLALSGHEKSCLPVFLLCLVLLLVGNFALISVVGFVGAALTVLIVTALWSVWLARLAKKKLGIKTYIIMA